MVPLYTDREFALNKLCERGEQARVREAVGVGLEDERAQERQLHSSEAAFGFAVEGSRGAVGEGQRLLERREAAGVGFCDGPCG